MQKIFQPGLIGSVRTKNRAVMTPMGLFLAEVDGRPGERTYAYYEERAKGGIGMIIVEAAGVDDINCCIDAHMLSIAKDDFIQDYEQLVERIHKYDVPVLLQINSYGANSPAVPPAGLWGISEVPSAPGRPAPHMMTRDEIKIMEQRYIDAAVRAKKAGFDGVVVHAAHSYLLLQSITPYYNNRTDEYGGSTENRCRMASEIISGIKAKLGKNFAVTVRFPGDQFTPDIPGTYGLDEGIRIAKEFEKAGADALDISNGNTFNPSANCEPFSYRQGWKKHVAKAIKEAVSIPVIATNTVKDMEYADSLLEEGVSDFVGTGRATICDPFFIKKAKDGDILGTRKCIGCLFCRERLYDKMPIYCAVNPRIGQEYRYPAEYPMDGNGRSVAVIGGGPAGMEAAVVMANRGFDVTLFEKNDELGGSMNLADKAQFKERITRFTETMVEELRRLGVKLVLGHEATPEEVKAINPIGIICACGAEPIVPNMPGVKAANVTTSHDVISGKVKVSGRVAVIGSGMTGLECAEKLAHDGCSISIIEMQDHVGPGMYGIIVDDTMSRILPGNPDIYLNHALKAVTENGVLVHDIINDQDKEICADYVVLSLGVRPRRDMLDKYSEICENIIAVGDNVQGGRIPQAVRFAYTRAMDFLR